MDMTDSRLDDIDFSFVVPNREIDTGTVKKHKKKKTDKDNDDNAREHNEDLPDANKDGKDGAEERRGSTENNVEPNINLSRDELLKLLSVFEGELQARDEVIAILKTECSQNPETRYGLATQPMKALQRDAATLDVALQDEECEQTKDQLKKIIQHQKESYKRLKQILLTSQDKYQRLSVDMEEEKRKHQEYMMKSDDFVNLLEHDRERLKQMLEQEKEVHDRKEKELVRKIKENKDELSRLKSLSLELVEERQEQLQKLNEQRQLATSHQRLIEELQEKVKDADNLAFSEKEHASQLENDLEEQTNKFYNQNGDLTAKLVQEDAKNKQLQEKIDLLTKQVRKLKCVDKNLRKTDDQLWRIKERLEQDERQDELLEEVELLRNTVSEMQEAEKIYVQAQDECKELRVTLESELAHTKALGTEVERLRKNARNQTDMERCVEEANFRLDEMQQLFDAECKKATKMKAQLEEFQEKLSKIDETDATLKMSEIKVRKLQQNITDLTNERDGLETKLQVEKDQCAQCIEMLEDERNTITKVSQKMIEESKKVWKLKEELAVQETKRAEEKEKLHVKLEEAIKQHQDCIPKEKVSQMETQGNNLRKQIAMLKTRLDKLEDESDLKENELKESKAAEERAKANLHTSTEKLKKLVSLGLNEQVAIAKYEEYKEKSSKLELANEDLRKKLESLEDSLRDEKTTNTNNNNIRLKGVPMSHISTQTSSEGKPPSPAHPRVAASQRSHQPRAGASDTSTRSSSVRRVSTSASRRETSVDARTQRQRSTSSSSSANQQTVSNSNGPIIVRLKGNDAKGSKAPSPVSMTISHDPKTEATPTFRIVRDSTTGSPHIETSVNEGKKGIQIRMPGKTKDKTPSTKPPASTGNKMATGKVAGSPKVTSRVTVTPTASSKARSSSKTQAARRESISPTRIPKLRGNTPTPSPASPSPTPTRPSRTASKSQSSR